MMKTIEAMIDTNSVVKFKEVVRVKKSQKVLVTFLEENATEQSVTLISEAALARCVLALAPVFFAVVGGGGVHLRWGGGGGGGGRPEPRGLSSPIFSSL